MTKTLFRQHLPQFFDKIDTTQPLRFKRFLLALAECGYKPSEIEDIFTTKQANKGRHWVSVETNHYAQYMVLKKCCLGDELLSERVIAAATGTSHSKNVSGALGLIHTEHFNISPCCIVFDNGVPRQLPMQKNRLLLIENLELFLKYSAVMDYINQSSKYEVSIQDVDVMYTQGSAIMNKQLRSFLVDYEEVLCLFDVDYGGLQVFNYLHKLHGNCHFVAPKDLSRLLDVYGFKLGSDEMAKLKVIANDMAVSKSARTVAALILRKKQKIEQEVYLLELT